MSHLHWNIPSRSASGETSLNPETSLNLERVDFLTLAHFPYDSDSFSCIGKDSLIEYSNSHSNKHPSHWMRGNGRYRATETLHLLGKNIEFWLRIFLRKNKATR